MGPSDGDNEGVAPAVAIARARSLLADSPALAEQQAREVLKLLPDDGRAFALIGAARRRMGDLAAARSVLSVVASRRPELEQAGWEFVLTLAALGEGAEAIGALRGLARVGQVDWLEAAGEFMLAGIPAETVAWAEHLRTLARGPEARAAVDALRAGRPRDAAPMLRPLLRRFSEDGPALWVMAEVHLALGHAAEAADLMERSLSRSRDLPGAHIAQIRMWLEAGRAEAALQNLASWTPDEQARGAAQFLIASCRLRVGDASGAELTTRALVVKHATYAQLWELHASTLRALGREKEASAALARAAALRPDREKAR